MQLIPVKTRKVQPPKDDLFAVLDEYLTHVVERDVVVISSKVVAISEGRCVKKDGVEKATLVTQEADILIPRTYWSSPLTITNNAFIGTAGIDESNGDGYYILLPENPINSAEKIHQYLTERFGLTEVGVVITDSHSSPLRRGAMGVSIGFWGFLPTINHVGEQDLFGREMRREVSNLADGLAASATVVMGETDECQPIVIIRDVPKMTFTDKDCSTDLFVAPHEDTFRVLYDKWL